MVLEDVFFAQRRAKNPGDNRLAPPFERFAAFLIDVVFVFPLINFIFSPFYREVLRASLFHQDHAAWLIALAGFALSLVTFILYLTITVYFMGGSFGKKLLGLRVVARNSQKDLDFLPCLIRAFSLLFSVVFVGVPFLSIFSDRHRRALHDFFANTQVLSVRGYYVSEPSPTERVLVKGAYRLVTVATMALISYVFLHAEPNFRLFLSQPVMSKLGCSQLETLKKDWPHAEQETRIKVAMGLYAAGVIDEYCLDQEANLSLWQKKNQAEAYLAKAFALSENIEISDAYLKKVCEIDKNSRSCDLSHLVTNWVQKDWEQISGVLDRLTHDSPLYVKIWALRHFMAVGQYSRVAELLEPLEQIKSLHYFVSNYFVKSHYELGEKEKASLALQLSFSPMEEQHKLSLTKWYCGRTAMDSCNGMASQCRWLSEHFENNPQLLQDPDNAVGLVRISYCSKSSAEMAGLQDLIPSEPARRLVKALILEKEGKFHKSKEMLTQLFKESQITNSSIHYESGLWLVRHSFSPKVFQEIYSTWKNDLKKGSMWELLGQSLAKKSYDLNNKELSYRVAEIVLQQNSIAAWANKFKAIESYTLGDMDAAQEYFNKVKPFDSNLNSQSQRAPAGVAADAPSEFDRQFASISAVLSQRKSP